MTKDVEANEKSGNPLRLFFIFAGIGAACLGGLLVLSMFGNRHIDRCFDKTSGSYIQDETQRAEVCG